MIELRTGIPGSGKTLSMVESLAKILVSWEKKPDLARPIFVHNIKELALAHSVMPIIENTVGGRTFIIPDWDKMPDGSLVLIDECQDVFPPRGAQSNVPPHIAFLNVHRHRGFDIWVTTQNPKLIDFSLRALVGKHMHYRRLFGGQRAAVYEWDGCSDSLSGMKNAVMSIYSFPKKAFQYYKSAETHNKQSFKLPRWLIIPAIGLALGVFAIPKAYTTITGAVGGKGLTTPAIQDPSKVVQAGPTTTVSASVPVQAALPLAPASAALNALPPPVVAGCMLQNKRCKCVDVSGFSVPLVPEMCADLLLVRKDPVFPPGIPELTQQTSSSDDLALIEYAAKRRPI